MDTKYIVVTANHSWGSGESIKEAFKNASLVEATKSDHFLDSLQYSDDFDLKPVVQDWKDYAKDEWLGMSSDDDKVACVIYQFNPAIWSDWEVSHIDGGVTFYPNDSDLSQEDAMALFQKNTVTAWWVNGELRPRPQK